MATKSKASKKFAKPKTSLRTRAGRAKSRVKRTAPGRMASTARSGANKGVRGIKTRTSNRTYQAGNKAGLGARAAGAGGKKAGSKARAGARVAGAHIKANPKKYAAGGAGVAVVGAGAIAYKRRRAKKKAAAAAPVKRGRR